MIKKNFYSVFADSTRKYFLGQALTTLDMGILAKQGMRGFKGVVRVRIVERTVPGDFLEVGLPLLVVSSKVLEIWEPFERFETYTVVIEGNVSSVEYSGVAFLGRVGPFDPEESKAVYSKRLDDKGKPVVLKQEGMYFDDSKWDGSDLLTIDEFPCLPIVTERVVKAMKRAKVTNCKYIPLEEYGIFK